MEARHVLPKLVIWTISLSFPALAIAQTQYVAARPATPSPVTTENFVVYAADQRLAQRVGREAERFRKELAIEWLGHELAPWQDKCPIQVKLGMHAGGETSFAFTLDQSRRSVPISWQMKIFGPPDRLLDAVLPHEITHTIFATHFGRPLPRWADEGACTTVEHESERRKNHQMLLDFLSAQPSRGLPFNRMFTMRNYPHDILPLYAQGYSLAKFLIMKKGRRYFLDYIGAGMKSEQRGNPLRAWDRTTEEFYGFKNLSDLQIAWIDWVRNGSLEEPDQVIVTNTNAPKRLAEPKPKRSSATADTLTASLDVSSEVSNEGSWYSRQMKNGGRRVAANRESLPLEPQPASRDGGGKTIWR